MASGPKRKSKKRPVLKSLSDIRRYFNRNRQRYYFVSATNFNLLNIDEWVRNFRFINYIDCFDGRHPNVLIPTEIPHDQFESIEDINNYLLSHKEVIDYIERRGGGGKVAFLMFNEQTEELCKELGLQVCFPSAELRSKVDDKLETTRLGNRAGVKSVPNILARIESYEDLCAKSKKLGKDLVVQTPYGDSGHTTFFISNKKDFQKYAKEIVSENEVKVMKRIRCRGAAIEACVTRSGTIVGPMMTELVGFPELTPYKGGWCGNEVFAEAFSQRIRNQARKYTRALGDELLKTGYRGYFEVDYLIDEESGKVYLGELNPRITGASSMTNLSSFAHADAPLFLFHLLEWADDVDFEIDVAELNERWSASENIESWSQLVIKHTYDTLDIITAAPSSGVWRMAPDGTVNFGYMQTHRRTVEEENEAFFLAIAKPGSYRYEGADLGILITPGRLMDEKNHLTKRAKDWIRGILNSYSAKAIPKNKMADAAQAVDVGSFKML